MAKLDKFQLCACHLNRLTVLFRFTIKRPRTVFARIKKLWGGKRLGLNKMEALVELKDVEKLSSRVTVIRGQNPGKMTLQGTNTYLVGTGRRRLLIDTGEGVPTYTPLLQKVLADEQAIITDIILTHRHHDHINGIPQVQGVTPTPITLWKRLTERDVDPPYEYTDIKDGKEFCVEGATLKTLYTPGHCDDHVVAYLVEDNVLFSGDEVLGQGTTVFESLKLYLTSLQRTLDAFPSLSTIYPAHGPVLQNGDDVIKGYIKHRLEREEQIIEALEEGVGSAMDVVKRVYKGYPEALWPFAEYGVRQHLEKLVEDGRVVGVELNGEEGWMTTTKKKEKEHL
ncbi:beta-lactamase-like protein [Chytridium lagenaria]|nr:beta-lactamase-like protein [Chytridium lagenaria]